MNTLLNDEHKIWKIFTRFLCTTFIPWIFKTLVASEKIAVTFKRISFTTLSCSIYSEKLFFLAEDISWRFFKSWKNALNLWRKETFWVFCILCSLPRGISLMKSECLSFLEDEKLDITLSNATTMHLKSDHLIEAIMPWL